MNKFKLKARRYYNVYLWLRAHGSGRVQALFETIRYPELVDHTL